MFICNISQGFTLLACLEIVFKKAGLGPDLSCVLLSPLRFIWKFSFVPKFLCLFELMLSERPLQQLWSCRDVASILLDLYPTLGRHDIQKLLQI